MNYREHRNILLEKYKAIYFILPKNGCSSMKAHFVEVLGMDKNPDYPKRIHPAKKYPFPFTKKKELTTNYQHYLRFCFARNPWDRLVSCFKDKIHADKYYNKNGYIDGVGIALSKYSPGFYGGMSFEEFVEVVCSIPDSIAEQHFRSQLYQLTDMSGQFLVNYIGHLERLKEGQEEITLKTGIPFSSFPHLHKTNRKKYQDYYNEELIEKVRKRFSADIEFFGYEFDQDVQHISPIGFMKKEEIKTRSVSGCLMPILKEKNQALIRDNEKLKKEKFLVDSKIRNTLSWKITAPLRKVASVFNLGNRK